MITETLMHNLNIDPWNLLKLNNDNTSLDILKFNSSSHHKIFILFFIHSLHRSCHANWIQVITICKKITVVMETIENSFLPRKFERKILYVTVVTVVRFNKKCISISFVFIISKDSYYEIDFFGIFNIDLVMILHVEIIWFCV